MTTNTQNVSSINNNGYQLTPHGECVKAETLPYLLDELAKASRARSRRRSVSVVALPVLALVFIAGWFGSQTTRITPGQGAQATATQAGEVASEHEVATALVVDVPDHRRTWITYSNADGSGIVRASAPAVSLIERADSSVISLIEPIVLSRTGSRVRITHLDDTAFIELAAELGQSVGVARVGNQTVAVGWLPTPRVGNPADALPPPRAMP